MIEADLSEGDLSQVTTAIQNALRPAQGVQRIMQIPAPSRAESPNPHFETDPVISDEPDAETDLPGESKRANNRGQQKRSFPTPEVVDVNWNVTPTVEQFVTEHPPKTTTDKFLVVLAWFKETSSESAVTANQVYTVFRKLKWPTAIKDFSQPLRDLKSQQVITGAAKTGFKINHIGAARVEEMKP